ncbi:MAG: hypothetical protein JSS10_04785 [Verrucomicrobia bacterium]|nr:hypothetical protein [Verrucomicrobiota bacterium]
MILCTGPSLERKQMLKENTERDLRLIPFKKIFLSSNDPQNSDLIFAGKKPIWELIDERGKQIDCLNCILTTIKNAVNDPTCKDDDIILFKHESLYINDMHLVRKAVEKILEGYDIVVRYWSPDKFYMTDAFFIKVSSARKIFQNHPQLTTFQEQQFCEEYFTSMIVSALPNVYSIPYSHFTRKDTELGLFHIPVAGEENWEGYWDKKNYHTLFKE